MGLKKKKNIIIMSLCVITCFILYQLYFFLTITSENANGNKSSRVIPVYDHSQVQSVVHVRSGADKFISDHGAIKGVLPRHMQRYRPDSRNEFKCLNSDQRIPFEQLNDDYCDCEDGSDEPSTSACPTGVFYCDTQYQKKPVVLLSVPSSNVNDGICDCCDGSDEWILEPNKKLLSQNSDSNSRYYVAICGTVC